MGASLSWFAVRGKAADEVLKEFDLENCGTAYHATPFCGGMLPSGWFLLICGRHEFSDAEAERLSRGCEVLACFVEEHVMISKAAGWKDGTEHWAVIHDAQQSDYHLEVRGEPPHPFTEVRDRLTRQQQTDGGADFVFEIPVELAKEITGYGHDEEREDQFDNFVKRSFFQRLFGG